MATQQTSASEVQSMQTAIAAQAVAGWRFARAFTRLAANCSADEHVRYDAQWRWFTRTLTESTAVASMKLVSVEGQPFDHGMSVTSLNMDEFESTDQLVVDQMIEPIIMLNDAVFHTGVVTLRKESARVNLLVLISVQRTVLFAAMTEQMSEYGKVRNKMMLLRL